MREETLHYQASGKDCQGFVVYPDNLQTMMPAVLVAHAYMGQDEFARNKARELAKLGYVAFCADLYGDRQTTTSRDEAGKLMSTLFVDRKILRERIVEAFNTMCKLPQVDPHKTAAIGFCFGGLTVIELLRSGVSIKAGVTFHGVLGNILGSLKAHALPAHYAKGVALLILHGYEDPLVPLADIVALEKELNNAQVDWQFNTYGHTTHAFTNPEAKDPKSGMQYHPIVAGRAWLAMQNFFNEILK